MLSSCKFRHVQYACLLAVSTIYICVVSANAFVCCQYNTLPACDLMSPCELCFFWSLSRWSGVFSALFDCCGRR